MLLLSQQNVLTTNNCLSTRSRNSASTHKIKWSNVIPVMADTWLAACSTVAMLFPKTSTLPLQASKQNVLSNSLIGVQLDSKSESTINHLLMYQEVILPRFNVLFACCP